jgi:hypothetical protein
MELKKGITTFRGNNKMNIKGISRRVLDTIELGIDVEGILCAFNNKFVVRTRSGKNTGFKIRLLL